MLRSRRLEPVLELSTDAERQCARAVADAEARVTDAQRRLDELQRYETDYRAALQRQTAAGIGVVQLRAFHGFIARLGEAVVQQGRLLARACEDRDRHRLRWQDASRRARAIGKAIEHAEQDERHRRERREQADLDERAQRGFGAAVAAAREPTHSIPGEEP